MSLHYRRKQSQRYDLRLKQHQRQIQSGQQHTEQHSYYAHYANKRAVFPAHVGVVRRVYHMEQRCRSRHCGRRSVTQQYDLAVHKTARRAVGPFGHEHLRYKRRRRVLNQLFYLSNLGYCGYVQRLYASAHRIHNIGSRNPVHIHQRHALFYLRADFQHFGY